MGVQKISGEALSQSKEFFLSSAERSRGLLKYQEPPTEHAAIFKLALWGFLPVVHTFGMKFPIDIVFCDSLKRVKFIYRSVKPGRVVAPLPALLGGCPYLVEFVNCDLRGLKPGDELGW